MIENLSSIAKNMGQSAIGNIEKAIIEIIDARDRQLTILPPVPMEGVAASFGGIGSSLNMDDTFAGVEALTDTLSQIGIGNSGSLVGVTSKKFQVQFNPNTLSFSGYGGGMITKTDFSSGKAITFEPADVRISMDVDLIFDKVDAQDAFMGDKLNLAPTALVTNTAKGSLKAAGKKTYSVQTEVEGFIAALRSPMTRRITFHWGEMNYSGVLNRVSAQYTMFNVQGCPIRAKVELSLVCADEDVSPNSMGVWQKYYNEAFGGGSQSYVQAAQKVSNLLNFNL